MADNLLSAEIVLQDGFTSVLQRFSMGLDRAQDRLSRLHATLTKPLVSPASSVKGFSTLSVKPIVEPTSSFKNLSTQGIKPTVESTATLKPLADSADAATFALNRTGASAASAASDVGLVNSAASGLKSTLLSVGAAMATAFSAGAIVRTADSLQNVRSRLALINDGKQTVPELEQGVYEAAQRSRTDMTTMGQVITRVGMNAGSAFSSTKEIAAFSEILAKQYAIAGATPEEMQNSIIQLTQGLGAGVLRGDELQSVFEGAPTIIQSIAKYLDVPIGKIRDLASEGLLTADIVKNAVMSSADDVNKKLDSMPLTWAQAWVRFKTSATMAFKPVLDQVSALANNKTLMQFTSVAIAGVERLGEAALWTFDSIRQGAQWAQQNLGFMVPVLGGMAAGYLAVRGAALATSIATGALSAAQWALNAAMTANPVGLVVLGMGALCGLVYAGVEAFNSLTGSSVTFGDVVGSVFGVVGGYIKNFVILLDNALGGIVNFGKKIWDLVGTLGENLWTSLKAKFYDFLSSVSGGLAKAFEFFGVEDIKWDKNSDKTMAQYADEFAAKRDTLMGTYRKFDGSPVYEPMSTKDINWSLSGNAKAGREWLDETIASAKDSFKSFVTPSLKDVPAYDFAANVSAIDADTKAKIDRITAASEKTAANTGNYDEEVKLMQEYGERVAVNRISNNTYGVNVTNNNSISNKADADSLIDMMLRKLEQSMQMSAEGVH